MNGVSFFEGNTGAMRVCASNKGKLGFWFFYEVFLFAKL